MTGDELARVRAQLDRFHRYLGMYTVSRTYVEAVALVGGYDLGVQDRFLDGFREWLVARLTDRDYANFAFAALVTLECVGTPNCDVGSDPEENQRCVDALFRLLDEYLAGLTGEPDD